MRQIRTEQNELRFGKHSFCVSQQHQIRLLEQLRVHTLLMGLLVPDVVDSDQDRNNVRTQIDAVLFPAGKQIRHAVSADAAVQHLNIRAVQAQIRLDQAGIAAARKSAAVIAAAQAIRNGGALK